MGITSYAQTGGPKNGPTCIPKTDTLDNQKVYSILEEMPEYPGGTIEMVKYFEHNLLNPNRNEDRQGSIYATFIIDTTGKIRNACIYITHKGNDELTPIEKDVLRIINEMPIWTPGRYQGKKVYSRFNLPIKF